MKVKFISTEGEYLEAVLSLNGELLHVMDEFSNESMSEGQEIDIDIFPGLYDEDESWESIFSGNPEIERKIEHISGWKYRIYGVVKSINPVKVDCGSFEFEAPIETNDLSVVGEPVAFTITRLQASV